MDVRDHEGIRWGSGGFWQRLNWLKFGAKEIKGDQVYQVFRNGVAGWWFGTFGLFFHILGMSSSQLLLTPSFFRGVASSTTNQWILEVFEVPPKRRYLGPSGTASFC